jgi:hypothetical protein
MSLYQYEIDFSFLSDNEKKLLINQIERISYTGLHWKNDFQSAIFFIDKDQDISFLKVPEICHLKRIFN